MDGIQLEIQRAVLYCLHGSCRWEEKLDIIEFRPSKAKSLGWCVQLRDDWEEVKVGIMEEIVRVKFTQNAHLKARLLAAGNAALQEGNTWNDTFWGVQLKTGKGQNYLSKILMKVRDGLKKEDRE